jgi:hypothetical protein
MTTFCFGVYKVNLSIRVRKEMIFTTRREKKFKKTEESKKDENEKERPG